MFEPPALCVHCKAELRVAEQERSNRLRTGVCDACILTHSLVFSQDGSTYYVKNVQRRFSHKGKVWHLTYRPETDQSTFMVINNKPYQKDDQGRKIRPPREEHVLPTFVTPERFINLLVFS